VQPGDHIREGRMRASIVSHVFFFFQAEDGIRDWSVTGVQTCALPISPSGKLADLITEAFGDEIGELAARRLLLGGQALPEEAVKIGRARVGKEGRGRGGGSE